jgi:hypothetical protein
LNFFSFFFFFFFFFFLSFFLFPFPFPFPFHFFLLFYWLNLSFKLIWIFITLNIHFVFEWSLASFKIFSCETWLCFIKEDFHLSKNITRFYHDFSSLLKKNLFILFSFWMTNSSFSFILKW